jgi:hypothetical protein
METPRNAHISASPKSPPDPFGPSPFDCPLSTFVLWSTSEYGSGLPRMRCEFIDAVLEDLFMAVQKTQGVVKHKLFISDRDRAMHEPGRLSKFAFLTAQLGEEASDGSLFIDGETRHHPVR